MLANTLKKVFFLIIAWIQALDDLFFFQTEVLGHVSSYQEDFDIDEVLELCKDHQVHDAAAHLLGRLF